MFKTKKICPQKHAFGIQNEIPDMEPPLTTEYVEIKPIKSIFS
jgi:hypothetical protein